MDPVYGFSESATKRIADAVRRVEGAGGETRAPAFPRASIQIVRITGPIDEDYGLYPGAVTTFTHSGSSGSWEDLGEVMVKASNDEALAEGDRVHCRFMGATDDGNYGIYATAHIGEVVRLVRVTSDTALGSGLWPAVILNWSGSAWASGDACRIRLVDSAGELFVSGVYKAVLRGTVDETVDDETTTYPLFHDPGNDSIIVPVCRDNALVCDRWDIPHPVKVTANVDCETGEPLE